MFTCVYRSPSEHSDKNGKLNDVIRKLCCKEYSPKLVVGDFNYPQIDWDVYSNQSTTEDDRRRFIDCVPDCYLYQYVPGPTKGRGTSSQSLLDLVMTNEEVMVEDIETGPPSELVITQYWMYLPNVNKNLNHPRYSINMIGLTSAD